MSEENNTEAQELDRLRTKNAELLAELKKVKGERDALSITVESHAAEISDFKVNKPVEGLLDKLLVASKYSSQELAEHFTFSLNEAGVLQMLDANGQPVTVTEKVDGVEVSRPIKCEESEVRHHLVAYGKLNHIMRAWANGGGAGHGYSEPPKPGGRTEVATPTFGLGRK
jgi:hypothetical protein